MRINVSSDLIFSNFFDRSRYTRINLRNAAEVFAIPGVDSRCRKFRNHVSEGTQKKITICRKKERDGNVNIYKYIFFTFTSFSRVPNRKRDLWLKVRKHGKTHYPKFYIFLADGKGNRSFLIYIF